MVGNGTTRKPARGRTAPKGASRSSSPVQSGRASRKKSSRSLSLRKLTPLLLFATFVAIAVGPVSANIKSSSRLEAKEKELAAEREITTELREQVRKAKTLRYVEEEARRQRLVAPGETLYIVAPDGSREKTEYRVKGIQSMDEAWERVRKMLCCKHGRNPLEVIDSKDELK
ncbi:MAG: septum formation initiator family protein [Actinomycetota bacterium]|nr:septum formation initiator family protein [Actinomycetota bacterium]